MTTEFSQTGHRYQLILRGECGPLEEGLFGDAAIESGNGSTSLIFSARDDSEFFGLLDRIQDLALHLISLYEIGGTEAVPHLPVRTSLAHPGTPPLYRPRDPIPPPMGSRGLATRRPGPVPETRKRPAVSPSRRADGRACRGPRLVLGWL